jgi:hypothetical protein
MSYDQNCVFELLVMVLTPSTFTLLLRDIAEGEELFVSSGWVFYNL